MPGQPANAHALLECPPEIRPRESPAAAGSAAIIRQAQEPHVSLNTLSGTLSRSAIQKAASLVKNLWTM